MSSASYFRQPAVCGSKVNKQSPLFRTLESACHSYLDLDTIHLANPCRLTPSQELEGGFAARL